MGFTIQDMLIVSKDLYQMELIAGQNGWANSISWLMMIEDTQIINNFNGKELAVTTGLGFPSTEKLMRLGKKLVASHAAGLIINTGEYIHEVPQRLIDFCDENDLPLITVPWKIILADMIKELTMQVFLQGSTDEQIIKAMISAIENPENVNNYRKELLPYYDVDGAFQIILISVGNLDEMDTVERRKLSYRLQIYLENITHNGIFFYYDGAFVLVLNDVDSKNMEDILGGMLSRTKRRMPEEDLHVGVGSMVRDIVNLRTSYTRAKSAVIMARNKDKIRVDFDNMGLFRLLYSVEDKNLLEDMRDTPLLPLIEYDMKHSSNYLETLELYLKYNGSIQKVSEEMYTHRNTVIYRISNIKKLIGCELETTEEKLRFQIAFYIRNM